MRQGERGPGKRTALAAVARLELAHEELRQGDEAQDVRVKHDCGERSSVSTGPWENAENWVGRTVDLVLVDLADDLLAEHEAGLQRRTRFSSQSAWAVVASRRKGARAA